MTISMHSASVPVFVRMLGNLLSWLDKAGSVQHRCGFGNIKPPVLVRHRRHLFGSFANLERLTCAESYGSQVGRSRQHDR